MNETIQEIWIMNENEKKNLYIEEKEMMSVKMN